MLSKGLIHEVRKSWYEYGEAIKIAFHFPPDAAIVAESLEAALPHMGEEDARAFIAYVNDQTQKVRLMKFLGER